MLKRQTDTFKALSDKNRLRIIKMLQVKPLCVCEITEILGLAASTVSTHLSILKNAGFIKDYKEGKWINYSINKENKEPEIASLITAMHFMLEDDEVVIADRQKLGYVDRLQITKKPVFLNTEIS
jgi:ArsR family transcriptional regulator, arsenate/arsenite/antimonite-responsive transcriptional repressor